jgi:hypothetical protein
MVDLSKIFSQYFWQLKIVYGGDVGSKHNFFSPEMIQKIRQTSGTKPTAKKRKKVESTGSKLNVKKPEKSQKKPDWRVFCDSRLCRIW